MVVTRYSLLVTENALPPFAAAEGQGIGCVSLLTFFRTSKESKMSSGDENLGMIIGLLGTRHQDMSRAVYISLFTVY